jgi:hypothetical protein
MKLIITLSLILISITAVAQNPVDSTEVPELPISDTVDLYVINNTNRLIAIEKNGASSFAFEYRDLKFLRTMRVLEFKNAEQLEKFFGICDKALATDKTYITQGYNISRNRLNKNVIRLNNKQEGYTLLKRETLEFMKSEFADYVAE